MTKPLDILILRDPRESTKKCSLTPLRGRDGVTFIRYRPERRVDADGRIILDPNGAPFTEADRGAKLLLIDCSWRRVAKLTARVDGSLQRRRLPELHTAYPRNSRDYADPPAGLASIEALYVASMLVGAPDLGLLDAYRWREAFLALNAAFFARYGGSREYPNDAPTARKSTLR